MTPEQLKASILQRAMEGKLVPQDPNDEPASELLKRIKAEKEKLIKEGKIKRDKNETEIFRGDDGLHYEKFQDGSVKQIDVPYEIPESWGWVKLNNIIKLTSGRDLPKEKYSEKEIKTYPYITGASNFSNFKIMTNRYTDDNSVLSYRGDILITVKGTIGELAFNPFKEAYIARQVMAISGVQIYSDYLFFYLQNSISILKNKGQSLIPGISRETILNLFIPIPPLKEQKRIIEILFEAIPKVKEYSCCYHELNRLNSEFPDKLRKSILQYAMQGKLVPQDATDEPVEVLLEKIREEKQRLFEEGKLQKKDLQESIIYQGDDNSYYENCPDTWAKVSLATISKITSGGTPKTDLKEYYNGEIPWFTPADLSKAQSNYYLDNSLKSITRLGLKNSSAQLIDAYSIVYSSRAPIGYINIVPKQYTTNQGCKSLTPYLVIVKWLYFAMKYATADIKKHASGTTFLEISASKLGDFYIDLPPISEQERIVDKIEKLWNKIDTLPFTL